MIVEVHLGLGLLLLLQVPQQVQPKVGDGGAGLAVGVVPVDDLYHGVTQVLQAVEDKFIALPRYSARPSMAAAQDSRIFRSVELNVR